MYVYAQDRACLLLLHPLVRCCPCQYTDVTLVLGGTLILSFTSAQVWIIMVTAVSGLVITYLMFVVILYISKKPFLSLIHFATSIVFYFMRRRTKGTSTSTEACCIFLTCCYVHIHHITVSLTKSRGFYPMLASSLSHGCFRSNRALLRSPCLSQSRMMAWKSHWTGGKVVTTATLGIGHFWVFIDDN